MPRGHYDRSHLKAKRAAAKAAKSASVATVAAGIAVAKSAADVEPAFKAKIIGDTIPLQNQLSSLTQTRGALCNNQVAFNAALVGLIDSEITAIVKAMAGWREANYPTQTKAAKSDISDVATKLPAPIQVPVPGIVSPNMPPAPLPFTPQTVQELQKSVSQSS